jgi:hypothetical protein
VAPTAQPTSLIFTPSQSSVAGSFTAASPVPDKYLVIRTPGAAALNTLPADGVTYTAGGTLGNGTIVSVASAASFSNTGLPFGTSYTYTIFSVNDLCIGGPLYITASPLTGSTATLPQQTYTWVATTGSALWSTPASWSPARNTPDATDILEFSAGGTSTATGIATATVARINVKNNTSINLQSSATATLTIASDGTVTDELNIASGSALTLNSTAAALTLTYSGTGSTGTIAGTAEVTSTSGALVNTFNFTGGTTPVTTVTASGVLAAGQSLGTGVPVITGSVATLIMNGIYNHKFQVAAGTIPTATWNTGSKVNITGYNATVTVGPSGFAQTFYDVEWNCPSQTTNIACAGTVPATNGTFTITSTGAGSNFLALTATTAYTKTWASFTQTGGVLDLATGASGANAITIPGTFNQSGGTFKSTGTATSSTTLNFSSSTTQSVTFTGQPAGPIIYRVSATNGITLNANIAAFAVGNGTLGGIRVSTIAATPITLGGSITSLQYATLNSTLTYDATGSYSMAATEFPASSGPANLTIAVGTNNVLTMPASFGSRSLSPTGASGVLTMTSGDLDISSNTLSLGTSAAFPGTLSWTAGNIRVTTGTLTRWFGTTGLPTSAGTAIGYFPLASGTNNRNVSIYFSVSTALSTGGTMTIGHSNGVGTTTVSVLDVPYTIEQRTNAYWPISQNALVASGTIAARITGGGLVSTTGTNLRLMQLAATAGTFVASAGTTPNFQVARTGLTVANIAQNQYIGAANADLGFLNIASGNWEDPSIWNRNTVPTATDAITINSGTTVTVNATPSTALSVVVNGNLVVSGSNLDILGAATTGMSIISAGICTVSGGTLNLGITDNTFCNRTLSNSGTLTVSSGTLNMYGNIVNASGSFFNQSGGSINIDGNAGGNAANSVASGTTLLQFNQLNSGINLTGGTLTIVDPHAATTASNVIGMNNATAGTQTSLSAHTTRFGNGVSTDAGGNAIGFRIDPWTGTAYLSLGSVVVNGPAGTNRDVTNVYYLAANGNVTVNSGGHLNLSIATFGLLFLGGDMVVNAGGIFTNSTGLQAGKIASNTSSNLTSGAVTIAQTISGAGIFQNLVTGATANFSGLQVLNSNTSGVTFAAGFTPTVSGAITITTGSLNADALTLNGSTAQAVALTAATSLINVGNFTLNNATGSTFSGSGKLNVTNTVTVTAGTLVTGGTLVLKSTAAGTARIAELSTGSITGIATQERYIPAKGGRTYSLVASSFSQAISSAWQQQVHITGTGTGGTVCGTAHSNGFDATTTNAASMFVYDGTKAVGSRWTSVTGTTGVSLAAGTGYRMNIRGPKSLGCALLDGSVTDVTAVTLSSTGVLLNANKNYGSFSYVLPNNLDASVANDNFLLTGNPYPSQISFSALLAANVGVINNTYAIYAPGNTIGNYAIWNGATFTGGNTGLVDATGNIIANGQAFFVQGTVAGASVTLNWTESMKTASVNNGYFRQLNPNRLRIGYMLANGNKADEIMIQFAANATSSTMNNEDIVSLNAGSQYLKSLKAGNGLAFNTRNINFSNDTVSLNVASTSNGSFKLNFFDFDELVSNGNTKIYLLDKYTSSVQLMNETKEYPFTVNMADAASFGTGRFAVVFSKPTPIVTTLSSGTMKAYPNPMTENNLTVELPEVDGGWSLSLVNMEGKVLVQQQVQSNIATLKIAKLAAGSYILQATDNKGNKQTQKLVKQ